MFKINLVPEVQEKKIKMAQVTTAVSLLSAFAVIGTVVALLIIGGIQSVNNTLIANAQNKINTDRAESQKYAELEKTVLALEAGLKGIKSIQDGDLAWTKLLPHLEKATPADIKFTDLNLSKGKIESQLEGKSVDSLARFVESFKEYKVVVITGRGQDNQDTTVTLDGAPAVNVKQKSDGTWKYAANFDAQADHTLKVKSGKNEYEIKYTAADKKITSSEASIQSSVKNLFTSVEVKGYSKKDNKVTFGSIITFDDQAIW